MNKQEKTDSEIVKLVLAGRVQFFSELVAKYEKLVFSFLLSKSNDVYEVEDVVQETFIKAYKHLATYDCERKFSAWVLTIARNLLYDAKKKNSKDLASTDLLDDVLLTDEPEAKDSSPDETVIKNESYRNLSKLIRNLDEEIRTPFLLRVLNELSYQEISDVLSLPLQTVKNRIFKARTYLREKRESQYNEMP